MPANIPVPRNLDLAKARRWVLFDDIRIPKLKAWALKRKSEAEILTGLASNPGALGQWREEKNGFKCWRDSTPGDSLGEALTVVLGMTAEEMDAVWNSISTDN